MRKYECATIEQYRVVRKENKQKVKNSTGVTKEITKPSFTPSSSQKNQNRRTAKRK